VDFGAGGREVGDVAARIVVGVVPAVDRTAEDVLVVAMVEAGNPGLGDFVIELNSRASEFLFGRATFDILRSYRRCALSTSLTSTSASTSAPTKEPARFRHDQM
jgi:hypothetical protein